MKALFTLFGLLITNVFVFGQTQNEAGLGFSPLQIDLVKAKDPIKLDGVLDEPFWQGAIKNHNFSQYSPTDSILAYSGTEIYMSYDDNNFYIAAKCYAKSNKFVVESLKRDYGFGSNDNISFIIDTYSDKTNAFLFGMNPFGVRREAFISNAGRTGDSFDPSWDNKWDGASKQYDNYWICELAIPLKTIRYKEGSSKWRFNSYRNDVQANEITTWIRIPRENILMDLTYMGEINFEEPLPKAGPNISIIPYINTSATRDFEDELQDGKQTNFDIGGDAKISVSSSLNLDLTVNPDFSQVDVDAQVTNLDRFEIFFPERRQFFLENADLFGRFGNSRLNPFFSRRIGVSRDTTTGNNIQNTIYGGARLSGKLNQNLRVGLLSMVTAQQQENDLPAFNYTVMAAEQRIFDRSNIGFIFVNKQSLDSNGFGDSFDSYDRLAGLEYRIGSQNNYWSGKVSYMNAITPDEKEHKFSHLAQINYNRRRFQLEWVHLLIGDGFDAETGFVPRKDILLLSPEATLRFFPKSPDIIQHSFSLDTRWIYKLGKDDSTIINGFGLEENGVELRWDLRMTSNNNFSAKIEYTDLTLLNDFDPTRIQEDDVFLSAGSQYQNTLLTLSYSTDRRKKVSFRINPVFGKFFDGTRMGVRGNFTYRYQPFGSIGLNYNYNRVKLDAPFTTSNLWLLGPRIDITFSKKHFLTTFIQYNNQIENLSINTRFQWRFAPASDLFIVYSDNYGQDSFDKFTNRNRGIVAKLTYWLNL
ncbi:MAG: carbohydrate binding family 9 domain-containing protein [Saprospiraceae bacterium]|nr:carbohydrate binding family 9 domain-containing protein [Bacteroidia bacterium]NNE14454.1 carbohydrate binding family 9 domain-containing protein [Saprospiraceae bacterium]NNL93031.1 carbohydrate binding family 9 domain-containing protein [Saprospiraceae bacterium]